MHKIQTSCIKSANDFVCGLSRICAILHETVLHKPWCLLDDTAVGIEAKLIILARRKRPPGSNAEISDAISEKPANTMVSQVK